MGQIRCIVLLVGARLHGYGGMGHILMPNLFFNSFVQGKGFRVSIIFYFIYMDLMKNLFDQVQSQDNLTLYFYFLVS